MEELDNSTFEKIEDLSELGNSFAENGDFENALIQYHNALDLLPLPKESWEASTWLYTAIGDVQFINDSFHEALERFRTAMLCPNAIGNPFLQLRLGQCLFENGHAKGAADELTRAYAIEGKNIFSDEDPRYFEFLKTQIELEKPKKKPWWKLWLL